MVKSSEILFILSLSEQVRPVHRISWYLGAFDAGRLGYDT